MTPVLIPDPKDFSNNNNKKRREEAAERGQRRRVGKRKDRGLLASCRSLLFLLISWQRMFSQR